MSDATITPHEDGRTKVAFDFLGTDGNVFAIMGNFRRAAREQGFNKEWIDSVLEGYQNKSYEQIFGEILSHCVDKASEALVEPKADDCPKDYKPQFWCETHPMFAEYERIWEEYVPSSGPCIGYSTMTNDETQTPLQLLLSLSRFYRDLYNNGLCNDKTEEAEYIKDNFELLVPYFANEQQAKEALYLFEFYLTTYEEEANQDTTCESCYGDGGEYVEDSWSCDEDAEEVWEDCDWCGGNGYHEEEYTDYYDWFEHNKSRQRSLDRALSAAVHAVIDNEDKIEKTYPYLEINCWQHRKWKETPYCAL